MFRLHIFFDCDANHDIKKTVVKMWKCQNVFKYLSVKGHCTCRVYCVNLSQPRIYLLRFKSAGVGVLVIILNIKFYCLITSAAIILTSYYTYLL